MRCACIFFATYHSRRVAINNREILDRGISDVIRADAPSDEIGAAKGRRRIEDFHRRGAEGPRVSRSRASAGSPSSGSLRRAPRET